jgi:hypothetical protein
MMKAILQYALRLFLTLLIGAPLCYWLDTPWYATSSILLLVSAFVCVVEEIEEIREELRPRIWYDRNK